MSDTEPNGPLSADADVWHVRVRPDSDSSHAYGVVDGDTLAVEIDLGFRARLVDRFRLYGVDTAETYGVSRESETYRRGKRHTAFTRAWVTDAVSETTHPDWPLRAYTLKHPGKFGRWLADVVNDDGESLTEALFDEFGEEVAYE